MKSLVKIRFNLNWRVCFSLALALLLAGCGGGGGGASSPAPPRPVAYAGTDQRVLPGNVVPLDGGGSSDATGSALTYSWRIIAFPPGGASPQISSASSVNATFTADQAAIGSYEIELSVVNARGQQSSDSVMVTASPGRLPDTGQTGNYTATFGEDSDYALNVPSYTSYPNYPWWAGVVTDNVTGLMWQRQDDAVYRSWADAAAYCASLPLGSYTQYSGWRLPTVLELMSIMDYGKANPAIDTAYFATTFIPNWPYWSSYWSSTPTADRSNVWMIFSNGHISYGGYLNYARCVRGTRLSPAFTDNADGTVSDAATALMWQKQDDGLSRTWDAALTYCEGLSLAGYSDWRLPNIKELYSIVDASKVSPAVDARYFPATPSAFYWSSTYGFGVNFSLGETLGGGPNAYARCVRGGV